MHHFASSVTLLLEARSVPRAPRAEDYFPGVSLEQVTTEPSRNADSTQTLAPTLFVISDLYTFLNSLDRVMFSLRCN